MRLTVVDRAIIANNFLSRFGTIAQVKLTKSIKEKIGLTPDEQQLIKVETDGTGVTTCSFNVEAFTLVKDVDLTEEEISHIRAQITRLDENGMIEESVLSTIEKIIED